MRALGVDHGEKRIGIAVSDATGTIARPLAIIKHTSRLADVGRVIELAREREATVIVIGHSSDEEGFASAAGLRAARFAEALGKQIDIAVVLWDESLSSQDARAARIAGGVPRRKRAAAVDSLAAAVILQSFLDAQKPHSSSIPDD